MWPVCKVVRKVERGKLIIFIPLTSRFTVTEHVNPKARLAILNILPPHPPPPPYFRQHVNVFIGRYAAFLFLVRGTGLFEMTVGVLTTCHTQYT